MAGPRRTLRQRTSVTALFSAACVLVLAGSGFAQDHIGGADVGAVFEGTAWYAFATMPATVAIENGTIRIESLPGEPGGVGVVSRCAISGDFDAQVDYRLTVWPTYGAYSVGLITADFLARLGIIGTYRSSSQAARRDTYSLTTGDSIHYRDATDLSGTLRLVRSAATITGYYSDASGSSIVGSGSIETGPTRISFVLARYTDAVSPAAVSFGRFTLNAGRFDCPNASEP